MAGGMALEPQTSLKRPFRLRNAHTNSRVEPDANPTPQRPFSRALPEEACRACKTHTRGTSRTPNPPQSSTPWICSSSWLLRLGSNWGERNFVIAAVNLNEKVAAIPTKTNGVGRGRSGFHGNGSTS